MAAVRPFLGLRPRKDYAKEVAALPYDVFSSKEARAETAAHPLSFLCIDRAETQFPEGTDPYSPAVYEKAGELLKKWVKEGIYIQEEAPVFYVYELTRMGHSQTGVVGLTSLEAYENGGIQKHEKTRKDKEKDRICHVEGVNAQTGPIFLAYRGQKKIRELLQRIKSGTAEYDFIKEDGVRHRVWVVTEAQELLAIERAFEQVETLYIADGHHRAASAAAVSKKRRALCTKLTGDEPFLYLLSVLFSDEELTILDYNRVVSDLGVWTPEAFLQELARSFEIEGREAACRPEHKGCFGMYLGRRWYHLTAKEAIKQPDVVEGLDAALLQREVLGPLLGILDPTTDQRIAFVGGVRGMEELEERAEETGGVSFSLYPTSMEELFGIADAGRLMPPKSTWFEPKLLSGLFIHTL